MGRVIRFLSVLPFLVFSGASSSYLRVSDPDKIPNWTAPPYWSPPASRTPGLPHTQTASTVSAPLPFVALTPCRLVDTRGTPGVPINTGGKFAADEARTWTFTGFCGLPASAAAASLNITVTDTDPNPFGYVKVWPAGVTEPNVSTLNWSTGGVTESNAGIVPFGTGGNAGQISLRSGNAGSDVIVDVNGYYDGSGTLQLSQSRRAILDQFWTPQNDMVLGLTTLDRAPRLVRSDGADLWVANIGGNSVSRVRSSDGKLLETWTAATSAVGVLVAMGQVFVTGYTSPGRLYRIDPSQAAGAVTVVASNLGSNSVGIAFDGARIWTANVGGSVSIVTPGVSLPWAVTTVTAGFSSPVGALFDGANIWVTDGAKGLLKLDASGAILQTVTVGSTPEFPIFDGTNIWVPNVSSHSLSVVRPSSGVVLATLTGNGLSAPISAAFDGQRVLVTNYAGESVSLWRAADLAPLGSFTTGGSTSPSGACSDGINFWVTLSNTDKLARF